MPDWLRQAFDNSQSVPWLTLLVRLVAALLLGSVVVGIHRTTRSQTSERTTTFSATLVMLCVLIAMVTQVIGDNFARAFSLAGVLSIVRFRTIVRDSKDTAFVIFAVVEGMAIGAGQSTVALIGLGTVAVAAAVFRDRAIEASASHHRKILAVKLVWSPEAESLLQGVLSKHTSNVQTHAASTIRQGSAMELTFGVTLLPTATLPQLVSELNRLDGVLSSEVRPAHPEDA